MDKKTQEELQRVMFEVESYKKQLEDLSTQMQLFEGVYAEMGETVEALGYIETSRDLGGMLVPLGSGTYIKTELKDNENVILGVGANISVEEPVGEARKSLEKRRGGLSKEIKKLHELIQQVSMKQDELTKQYNGMIREIQQRESLKDKSGQ